MARTNIVVLSGAGISAESGIKTFRDQNGLWENHDVMEVASPRGWSRNPDLVNRFYNARRAQLSEVEPNAGHRALAELEQYADVQVVTQNVDDLHERAGSSRVLHLHGELRRVRCSKSGCVNTKSREWLGDLSATDRCSCGAPLRPDIVWFREDVPKLQEAAALVTQADLLLVVGTSLQVYPAAGLVGLAPAATPVYYVDPRPGRSVELDARRNLIILEENASSALPKLVASLKKELQ